MRQGIDMLPLRSSVVGLQTCTARMQTERLKVLVTCARWCHQEVVDIAHHSDFFPVVGFRINVGGIALVFHCARGRVVRVRVNNETRKSGGRFFDILSASRRKP